MADIKDIENLEPGYSVRAKLNASIAEANKVDGIRTDLDVHVEDKNNPHDTNFGNIQGDPADANIPHDALIDVTPDQHHPQLHDLDSHTDVVVTNPRFGQGLFVDETGATWVNRTSDTETWPTGLANGGELNIGPGINDIEVIAGAGVIMDNYTDPLAPPVITGITWPQINEAITAAPAVAGSIVWFSIYDTGVPGVPVNNFPTNVGALRQYPEAPSPTLSRQEIFLGTAVHNGVTWNEISNPKVVNQAAETLREVATTVLPLTTILSGAAINELPNFELDQTEGIVWENNRNWHVDKSDPNREALPAQSPMQFQYVNRDFTTVGTLTSTVDPTLWDNNGVVEAVPGPANETTIQRLYLDPANNYWILYGQFTYPSFDTANANLFAETPVVPFLLQQSVLLGYIIAEKAKNDWDIDEAIFVGAASGPGSSGSGGSPITVHDNLTGITPDNHHNQVHLLYGTDHSDVDSTSPIAKQELLAWDGVDSFDPGYRTLAKQYNFGVTYYIQDMVYQDGWLMVANTETDDFPAPTPVGEPTYTLPDAPAWAEFAASAVIESGHRYVFSTSGYFRALRIWVPETGPTITYRITSIRDPSGTPRYQTIDAPILAANQWNVIAADTVLIAAGEELLIYIEALNSGSNTIVTGGWARSTNSNDVTQNPGAGEWGTNNAGTTFRQSKTDLDTTDRSTELAGIVPGSTIVLVETLEPNKSISATILSAPVDQGTHFSWNVEITNIGVDGFPDVADVTTFTATIPVAQSTKFVGISGYWVGNEPSWANVDSYLAFDGVDQGADINNAYGVDISFQELTKSDDWDVFGVPGGGGGGGGDFTPDIFAGAGTTGYVPDPVEENGLFLRDDGSFAQAGGATETIAIQSAHGFTVGQAIAHDGAQFNLALANSVDTTALGIVTDVINPDAFRYAISGMYDIGTHGYTLGEWYYLSDTVPGGVEPTEPAISQPLLYIWTTELVMVFPYRPSVSQPASLPMIGEIKQYYGDLLDLTPGWHECDGTNGTPDLRDRVVMGAGSSYAYDSTGGAASAPHQHTGGNGAYTLTFSELPSHNHPMFQSGTGSGDLVNGFQSVAAGRAGSGDDNYKMAGYTPGGTPTLGYTGNQGGGGSHTHPAQSTSNVAVPTLPPYRALYNIMYIGV